MQQLICLSLLSASDVNSCYSSKTWKYSDGVEAPECKYGVSYYNLNGVTFDNFPCNDGGDASKPPLLDQLCCDDTQAGKSACIEVELLG